MKLITLFLLAAVFCLSACQVNGTSNGKNGNANIFTNVLTLEF